MKISGSEPASWALRTDPILCLSSIPAMLIEALKIVSMWPADPDKGWLIADLIRSGRKSRAGLRFFARAYLSSCARANEPWTEILPYFLFSCQSCSTVQPPCHLSVSNCYISRRPAPDKQRVNRPRYLGVSRTPSRKVLLGGMMASERHRK